MNLTEAAKTAQRISTKIFAAAYVLTIRVADGARWSWKHRRELAPVIARYSIAFMLGVLVALFFLRAREGTVRYTQPRDAVMETVITEPVPVQDEAQRQAEELEAIRIAAERKEAQAMARVLYGTAQHHSREAQKAVCWCILNRVESSLFPNSVEEVCSQSKQWMGYSDTNPVTQDLYDVADEVLTEWRNDGIRPFGQEFLFLSWSEDQIILRNNFNETKTTRYYHVNG